MYEEDDMLMLSGIQHFMFCPRQWALIHMDQQWADNRLTIEGQLLHSRVDNPFTRQKNGDVITLRSVTIASKQLGLYGLTDVIELKPTSDANNGIIHPQYTGYWIPYPIEYKRGHKKPDERDEVQVAAQAICLEEMYGVRIPEGYIFYGETRHRVTICINEKLRILVQDLAKEMHTTYESGKLPKAVYKTYCKSCSLYDICMPKLSTNCSVSNYLTRNLYEETS